MVCLLKKSKLAASLCSTMRNISTLLGYLLLFGTILQCRQDKKSLNTEKKESNSETVVEGGSEILKEKPGGVAVPQGMVWIPGGIISQGAVPQDERAMGHEKPTHRVAVDGFFMDITEVTNAQFTKFVTATKYETIAERAIDWEEMKKQLPEGTPKPHDSIMQPGSLTFRKTKDPVPNLYDFSQWWKWTIGANWKQPNGPGSSIEGRGNDPVVHIAYEDAQAYCEWAGRRLPTEAEWERAAKGNNETSTYFWGDDETKLDKMANTWEGQFPVINTKNYQEVSIANQVLKNPMGAERPFNERDPYAKEKVMKGGSFLCNASYCASYRISARMATSLDSSLEHLGFRTVATVDMVRVSEEN